MRSPLRTAVMLLLLGFILAGNHIVKLDAEVEELKTQIQLRDSVNAINTRTIDSVRAYDKNYSNHIKAMYNQWTRRK